MKGAGFDTDKTTCNRRKKKNKNTVRNGKQFYNSMNALTECQAIMLVLLSMLLLIGVRSWMVSPSTVWIRVSFVSFS